MRIFFSVYFLNSLYKFGNFVNLKKANLLVAVNKRIIATTTKPTINAAATKKWLQLQYGIYYSEQQQKRMCFVRNRDIDSCNKFGMCVNICQIEFHLVWFFRPKSQPS